MRPLVTHVIGNIKRPNEIGRKLGEKYREGYTLFNSVVLPASKHLHPGVMCFALELNQPFPPRQWKARENKALPQGAWLAEYGTKTKTRKRK